MSRNDVLAVIVTHNRLKDLALCLDSLRGQSLKCFDILVVNNGSSDGTKEFLDDQEDLFVIHQENLGGAGGFYAGMKYMYEREYQWIWMMDDDGIPENGEIESLLRYSNDYMFLNALVVDKDDHTLLAFGRKIKKVSDCIEPIIVNYANPFNGTFISREVITRIGFIKKEMFIWGDEREYMARAKRNGFLPCTIVSAVHYHPHAKETRVNIFPFFRNLQMSVKPKSLSKYYYRNIGYLQTIPYGRGFLLGVRTFLMYTIYFGRTFQFDELWKFYKYFCLGLFDNYKVK